MFNKSQVKNEIINKFDFMNNSNQDKEFLTLIFKSKDISPFILSGKSKDRLPYVLNLESERLSALKKNEENLNKESINDFIFYLSKNPIKGMAEVRKMKEINRSSLRLQTAEGLKIFMRAFNGIAKSSHTQLLHLSNSITYSFRNKNNYIPLITSSLNLESFLKNYFLSLYTLISKPYYINRHDKIIIRLFVFIAHKFATSALNTSSNKRSLWSKFTKDQILFNQKKISGNYLSILDEKQKSVLQPTPINNELKKSFLNHFKLELEKLSILLSKYFQKKVEFEIIRLQYPFHNSEILSQVLGLNANKFNLRRIWLKLLPLAVVKDPAKGLFFKTEKARKKKESVLYPNLFKPNSYLPPLFKKSGLESISIFNDRIMIPNLYFSYLSGINVRLGGRLMTQAMRARFSVQTKQSGSLARFKVDLVEKSRFTGKNKRGAYSFTVTISHVIN